MKKYIITILFFAFTATAVKSQQQCMLTSPVAASAWIAGNTMPIQWNAGAFTGNVNLSLIDYSINYPNGQVVVTIATNVANTGTYNWLIPNTLPAKCTYGLYVENIIKTNWCYGPGNICISPVAVSSGCCPKFSLGADFQPCDTTCKPSYPNGVGVVGNPGGGAGAQMMQACKNITHTYTVYPNLPGFIYTWTVVGGTPNIYNGNPIAITWGNSSQGFIQVIITSADGTCRDTIKRAVCLVDGPVASFTYFPNPVCLSPSFVQFTSTSVGGSSYYWDFGDGSSSTLQNPTHA